ncbi:hypothetical protein WV31_10210 [Magnetospirillum sp. ME-1]|uniref:hypothetical protein n=1 Tax=Magnetospirillum sp. ME-1 TaxID=1639348 RepID=UPI000A17BB9A|nr:hypothetical protein [Magnetospirillum sp. ME-1]ARJ65999.1 hypothetical protein WV31_10210 [Magnetospirillum sp. ME-1]
MTPDLEDILRRGRMTAPALLAFLASGNAPKDWNAVWEINDRISHLAQDCVWCAAVAEASAMDTDPRAPALARLLRHEDRIRVRTARGVIGSPDYWGDLGKASTLRPDGSSLDISIGPDGRAVARLRTGKEAEERCSINPAAAICWTILKRLAMTDPCGNGLSGAKAEGSPFLLPSDGRRDAA